jgi:ribosomal protein S18 acetylase RimI-like enzyme
MLNRLVIRPARESELNAALEIVFHHHAAAERQTRSRNALRLIQEGELDPAGVLVALDSSRLCGAMVCLGVPGASAMVWPPQAVAGANTVEVEDQLLDHGMQWLWLLGTRLVQALLLPTESELAKPLLRTGFRHVTNLEYLRHTLRLLDNGPRSPSLLTFVSYAKCDRHLFDQTLLSTYRDTLDCPEVNGVRDVEEIIEGHRSQGMHDPERWWLAFYYGQPAGVLLLTDVPDWNGWDVSYVGVVPELRRKGVGTALTRKALLEARSAGAAQLTLALDIRNAPASQLYRSQGFTPFDERQVYLAIRSSNEVNNAGDRIA